MKQIEGTEKTINIIEWRDIKFPPINLLCLQAWSNIMATTKSSKYETKFYEGKYKTRQNEANKDGAILYVEQHFNSHDDKYVNYAMAVVANNASNKSKEFAIDYVNEVSKELGISTYSGKIRVGGLGNGNLINTMMPAVILEPCFISSYEGLDTASSYFGQALLAECLVDTIKKHFPEGGLIALSVGHEGNKPSDMGVVTHKGTEAEFAREVLTIAESMLAKKDKVIVPVIRNNKEVAHFRIFEGEQIMIENNKVIVK